MIEFLREQRMLPKSCEEQGSKGSLEEGFTMPGHPDITATSWLNLPFHGMDFGWGKEIHMSRADHDFDGDVVISASHVDDGSIVVAVGLQVTRMEKLMKFFYDDIEM